MIDTTFSSLSDFKVIIRLYAVLNSFWNWAHNMRGDRHNCIVHIGDNFNVS